MISMFKFTSAGHQGFAGILKPAWGVSLGLLLASFTFSCGCKKPVSAVAIGTPITLRPPLGLPALPVPDDNRPTAESIALGRRLFYDSILSKDNSIACASCHDPQHGFADSRELSFGVGGTRGHRNAPTLVNAAYSPEFFWDGRAPTLEAQVGGPMADALEMNQAHDVTIAKLKASPVYGELFRKAYGSEDITMKRVENAIASFERTILCGNSAFDRYEYEGRKDALSAAQVRGLAVFQDPLKGNCAACHSIGPKYALFTDGQFHDTGEGVGDNEDLSDEGRFTQSKLDIDRGAFKTPTLRAVAITGPYMHDGKLKTLKDVVDFYAGKGNSNPNLDERMKRIELSGQDRSDLVEFMKSLTGELPPAVGPPGKE
jgi:cytochrome c peroxidase